MTSAIVLAAGLGRRLAPEAAVPKWLIPVNESCPAQEQLGSFHGAGLDQVLVVVGDAVSEVERAVERWGGGVPVQLIRNPESASLNNWYSLLLGLDEWLCGSGDDVVVNSDLFAARGWFEALLQEVRLGPGEAALAVDPARGGTDEAMKVSLDRSRDRVSGIGKTGVDSVGGEYVGLAWWNRHAAKGLLGHLEGFVGVSERADHWYEHAIQEHLSEGAHYAPVPVPSGQWVEIDDRRDLAAARQLGV